MLGVKCFALNNRYYHKASMLDKRSTINKRHLEKDGIIVNETV
jgi:hypothetical protein